MFLLINNFVLLKYSFDPFIYSNIVCKFQLFLVCLGVNLKNVKKKFIFLFFYGSVGLRFYLKSATIRCEGLRFSSATLLKK